MDPLEDLSIILNGFKVDDPFQDIPLILPDSHPSSIPDPFSPYPSSLLINVDSWDHCELSSDMLMNYIEQILMDENIEVNSGLQKESSALQATEKPFHDIYSEERPPCPDSYQPYPAENSPSSESGSGDTGDSSHGNSCCSHINDNINSRIDSNSAPSHSEYPHQREIVSPTSDFSVDYSMQLADLTGGSGVEAVEGYKGISEQNCGVPEIFSKEHILQFQKGVDEGNKFLPNVSLSFNLQMDKLSENIKQFQKGVDEGNKFLPNMNLSSNLQMDKLSENMKQQTRELLPSGDFATDIQGDNCFPALRSEAKFISNESDGNGLSQELEEANKLLLSNGNMIVNLEKDALLKDKTYLLPLANLKPDGENKGWVPNSNLSIHKMNAKMERNAELLVTEPTEAYEHYSLTGRKNPHDEDLDMEAGRSNKQLAISSTSETVRSEMFDQVLLYREGKCFESVKELREAMQNISEKKNAKIGISKGSTGTKTRSKKQGKTEVLDLRSILITCAQAVSTDDHRNAKELLKQIRQQSSPHGDGMQRLAHYFVEGLESRLAGTGSQIYSGLITKRASTLSILKSHHLFCVACPFFKLAHFFANQTILDISQNARKLHIVDFGILYGFQWPSFIQRLSARSGGPPQLRITGIDFPQRGFKPAERIEETGRRLSEYARMFNVPFHYKAITSKWENVDIEGLELDSDELLVVNCLFRLRHLPDEMVVVDCPKDIVLNNIRKMKPRVFISGINNGAFSTPFFDTRFREAMFFFSALFDMLEATTPRDHPERILIEREIFGREILNIVACEGADRIERPETYKQWQVRFRRAGFVQLPLDQRMIKRAKQRGGSVYHNDFMVDEDSQWLLQGWKGRIIQALAKWVPKN